MSLEIHKPAKADILDKCHKAPVSGYKSRVSVFLM